MAFSIVHTDHSLQPWEQLPANVGEYKAGQALKVNNGKVEAVSPALTTVPPYICMGNKSVKAAGEMLPVIRVTEATMFEAPLTKLTAGAKPGAMLQVSAGGLGVDQTAPGSFEVVYAQGTAQDDMVRGRFVTVPGGGV